MVFDSRCAENVFCFGVCTESVCNMGSFLEVFYIFSKHVLILMAKWSWHDEYNSNLYLLNEI